MSFKIITISREFGSGGRFIGEQIAQKCGIEFYDKKIIEHVAKELAWMVGIITAVDKWNRSILAK